MIMKQLLILLAAVSLLGSCTSSTQPASGNRAAAIVAALHDPSSRQVLVISHRGDWRNWPENSLPAIESAIAMGVDIVEIDLKLTADSVLVLCHDKKLDRTTSGRGLVGDLGYDSIRRCVLRTGHNVKTRHRMPTLREALEICKDRIVVNVDQGYEYYDLVLAQTEELGMTGQVLIKGKLPLEAVAQKFAEHPRNMMYMPIIDILKPQGAELFAEYLRAGVAPLAYEVCWDELTPDVEECMRQVVKQGTKLWVNSLWPSLCGGLDDDTAYTTSCDEVYGRLVELGATLIQTDRPELLLNYLRARGLHD